MRSSQRRHDSPDSLAKFVTERVEVETAIFSFGSFEVDGTRKLVKKEPPSKALLRLPSLGAMSETYHDVVKIYQRRLGRAMEAIKTTGRNTKEWKALKATALALNIDVNPNSMKNQ